MEDHNANDLSEPTFVERIVAANERTAEALERLVDLEEYLVDRADAQEAKHEPLKPRTQEYSVFFVVEYWPTDERCEGFVRLGPERVSVRPLVANATHFCRKDDAENAQRYFIGKLHHPNTRVVEHSI